jgi:prolipoprotein diacylglyceryltransferase
MRPTDNDEYVVPFKGAKVNRDKANQAGFGIIGGFIGVVLSLIIFGADHKSYSLILAGAFAGLGLFGYAYLRRIKKSKKT